MTLGVKGLPHGLNGPDIIALQGGEELLVHHLHSVPECHGIPLQFTRVGEGSLQVVRDAQYIKEDPLLPLLHPIARIPPRPLAKILKVSGGAQQPVLELCAVRHQLGDGLTQGRGGGRGLRGLFRLFALISGGLLLCLGGILLIIFGGLSGQLCAILRRGLFFAVTSCHLVSRSSKT